METQEALAMTQPGGRRGRLAADTVPAMFWRSVAARGAQVVILRQKKFGIWQSVTWAEFGADRARDRHGAGRARL